MEVKMNRKLTYKQKRFCKEYAIDFNATQSAIRAGYSKKTAYSQGQRLLKKVEIKNSIRELENKHTEEVEITVEDILRELKKIAFDLQSEEVRYRDKLKALELLGKHLSMWTDRQEITKIDQRIVKIDLEAEDLVNLYISRKE
ncbi:MAG: terminase small subunit [Candidatus Cloacimonetes bacterium]|nr:terminase small subunit [Candidatus Cloacimonadota bacterium]